MEAEQKAIEQVVAEYKKAHEGHYFSFFFLQKKETEFSPFLKQQTTDSQKLAQNSSKLQTQINENEMVKRVFIFFLSFFFFSSTFR